MNKLIHAYTETTNDYPAFINISSVDGGVSVTVRSRGNGGQLVANIILTPEQAEQLAVDIMAGINS